MFLSKCVCVCWEWIVCAFNYIQLTIMWGIARWIECGECRINQEKKNKRKKWYLQKLKESVVWEEVFYNGLGFYYYNAYYGLPTTNYELRECSDLYFVGTSTVFSFSFVNFWFLSFLLFFVWFGVLFVCVLLPMIRNRYSMSGRWRRHNYGRW